MIGSKESPLCNKLDIFVSSLEHLAPLNALSFHLISALLFAP
jgi:hypothetical protein